MQQDIHDHLVLDIISILADNQAGFEYLKDSKGLQHKAHRAPRRGQKTEEYVLRTVPIEEATTVGNISVAENIYVKQLRFAPNELDNAAIPCVNDQLTNSRVRSALEMRRGDESALERMENFQLGIGLFHLQMNLLWAIFNAHLGSKDDRGSLQFHITLLGLKRLGKEHPDYYTLRSFMMDVLAANLLLCWESKCEFDSLAGFARSKPSADNLKEIASEILRDCASDFGLQNCVEKIDPKSKGKESRSDETLRNMILLTRDLLYFFELDKAISSGDFGRAELLLGTLCRIFAGAGSKNYSSEILHLLQNFAYVWPKDFG